MNRSEALLTVREVATYLACAEETVKRLVRRGELAATRVGNRLRFDQADIEAYRTAHASPAARQASPSAELARPSHTERTDEAEPTAAAAYLTRLQLVTGVFSQLHTPAQAAELVLRQCMRALNASSGILTLVRDQRVLELVHALGYPLDQLQAWREMALDAPLPLPDVIRRGEPRFFETTSAFLAEYPQLAGTQLDNPAWAIIPLSIDTQNIGSIGLAFTTSRTFSLNDRAFLLALAQQCAQAIERARLFQRANQHAARVQAIAEAAQVFSAAQLDLPHLLERIAQHIGTVLGDNCTIRLVSADHQFLELAAVYHPDPTAHELLRTLATAQPQRVDEGLTGRVFQTGQPIFVTKVDQAELRATLKPIYWPYVERVGMASILAVPLRVRDEITGTIFVSRDRPGNPYRPADQTFLLDLANRAAIAIAYARLYAAEQQARAAAEQAAERTAILQHITAELSNLHTPTEIADIAMSAGGRALGATAGALSLLNDDGTFMIVRMLGYPAAVVAEWVGQPYSATIQAPIPEAVRAGAPIWLESTEAILARYPNLAAQLTAEHRGAWATVPLAVQERVFGGMTFLFAEPRLFSDADRGVMLALAQQCAQAIDRARLHAAEQHARAEAETAREQLALLAGASMELAMSLDVPRTLDTLAHLVVPKLADWCVVDMLAEDGTLQTLVVAHADPAREAIGWEMTRRYPLDSGGPSGRAAVLRTLQPELIPAIDEAMLAAAAADAEHLSMLKALGMRSTLCVPLVARGRALGTIALVAAESGRSYSAADLPFVEDLARRAALAADNARLYHEAQQAIRLRDTFFSIAAHELKTPLTSLLGQAQLILRRANREGDLSERNRHSLQVIERQAARLNHMILAMLDTARLEQGQLSLDRHPLELGALVQRVVAELQPTFEQHTIAIRGGEPVVVLGDAMRLELVLQNLISNAVKYSPHGGHVDVLVERNGGMARIAVRDEGIGIPAAAIPQLFQRFYRARNADERHITGLGIGLYVVKEIINLHGGTVAVSSAEGQGSTFSVLLPLIDQ